MSRITVLGLGAMGSRMAHILMDAGHEVTVWNRTGKAADRLVSMGAKTAPSPREATRGAEFVIGMVRDDAASRSVWLDARDGAVWALAPDAIAIESSTLTPGWVKELAGAVGIHGAAFLDAPVAGSRPQAEAGRLVYMVGGDKDAFDRARPVLEVMGSAVHHVGPTGHGAVLKLVVNALFGIQVAAMGELLGFLDKSGLDRARAIEILSGMPVTSPAAAGAAGLMAAGDFAPMFPIDLVEKDFRYALESGAKAGAEMPTTKAVLGVYEAARSKGHGSDNIAGVAQLFR